MEGELALSMLFYLLWPKAGFLPCCPLSPDVYSETYINKNCYRQAVLARLTSRQLNQTVALRIYLPYFSHCGTTDKLLPWQWAPVPIRAGNTQSFFLAMGFFCCGMKGRHCQIYYYFWMKMFWITCLMNPPLDLGGVMTKLREGLTGQVMAKHLFFEQKIPCLTNSRGPRDSQSFHGLLLDFWFLIYKHEIRA